MSRPRRLAAALLAILAAPTVAGAHELGDFGRVKPGVVNDDLIPFGDRSWRYLNGQPVSDFNITDEEREMHDRVYRFLISAHAEYWAIDYEDGVKLARMASRRPEADDLYYLWLRQQHYQSSRVRFNTIADDVGRDVLTLPTTFEAICAVIGIDKQRRIAAAELPDIERKMLVERQKREDENELYIGRFVDAVNYRYASYSYALDHFLVETPHAEAVEVDSRLSEMAIWVDRANARDFCSDWGAGHDRDEAIPGRRLLDAPDEGPYRK